MNYNINNNILIIKDIIINGNLYINTDDIKSVNNECNEYKKYNLNNNINQSTIIDGDLIIESEKIYLNKEYFYYNKFKNKTYSNNNTISYKITSKNLVILDDIKIKRHIFVSDKILNSLRKNKLINITKRIKYGKKI